MTETTRIDWATMTTTKAEYLLILKIAKRADGLTDRLSLLMDIEAVHSVTPINLEALAEASPLDFSHDISGIVANIDRTTGELLNCFVPRFAA